MGLFDIVGDDYRYATPRKTFRPVGLFKQGEERK